MIWRALILPPRLLQPQHLPLISWFWKAADVAGGVQASQVPQVPPRCDQIGTLFGLRASGAPEPRFGPGAALRGSPGSPPAGGALLQHLHHLHGVAGAAPKSVAPSAAAGESHHHHLHHHHHGAGAAPRSVAPSVGTAVDVVAAVASAAVV